MIAVTVDVLLQPGQDRTAIWEGCWPQVPAKDDTFEIRSGAHHGFYVVENVHWVLFAGDPPGHRFPLPPAVSSATVNARPWSP